ncbi:MAG: class I SAM-dependent methyltransferase [Planctomycetota bacterium]|jgi:2-polyprenyl-3-methyl-5-hydroxy-6-metoxy-1,4-benzoquinol methylase|nr:class I SAM-dependent methyltransferase [Planctomycetota bacterium]MDP6940744.1 class I SAM-dependent methyltransferase [Planctomycetota bacterium]
MSPSATSSSEASQPCNLCGANRWDVLFEAGVAQEGRIVRCCDCDLLYVHPRKRIELEDYRERGEGDDAGWELSPSSLERQNSQIRDYRTALSDVVQHAPGGKVLEIGCCSGTLLGELKTRGMDCMGLEPNGHAARYGRETFELDIRTQILSEANLESESFDVVLLLHVVEHLEDPLEVLSKIRKLLKPGGMFIIETPRYDTWSFKLLGRRERNIVDNWHLYFFTKKTLVALLVKAGFSVEKMCTPGRTVNPSRLLIVLGKSLRLKPIEALGQWLAKRKLNEWLSFPINLGDILRVTAKAPSSRAQ